MTSAHVRQLPLGLYRITWKASHGGGQSLGVVGMRKNGQRWLACSNWVMAPLVEKDGTVWESVRNVKLVASNVSMLNRVLAGASKY